LPAVVIFTVVLTVNTFYQYLVQKWWFAGGHFLFCAYLNFFCHYSSANIESFLLVSSAKMTIRRGTILVVSLLKKISANHIYSSVNSKSFLLVSLQKWWFAGGKNFSFRWFKTVSANHFYSSVNSYSF
jgi:hypothetical protein